MNSHRRLEQLRFTAFRFEIGVEEIVHNGDTVDRNVQEEVNIYVDRRRLRELCKNKNIALTAVGTLALPNKAFDGEWLVFFCV